MSLQARTRPSFQAELDLRTAADELMEKRRKKCCICSLKRPPEERRLAIVFFFPGFPEKTCAYILIIVMYVDVCTLPLLVASCAYWLMTGCVVSTIIRLIALDLLCFHSNVVPQYLEQTIRDTQTVGPV